MRWFGDPWPSADYRAPVCEDDRLRIPVPVGEACLWCDEPIGPDDRGEEMGTVTVDGGRQAGGVGYAHVECLFRQVLGGPAHLDGGSCEHCGGAGDPDLGMTRREAARAVWNRYQRS